ncbi:hypothetical protein cypCar_00047137, partial [Cyprinus carpio]
MTSHAICIQTRMAVWDLSVSVEELGPEAPPLKISVTSDLHIGGVILKTVEKSHIRRPEELSLLWPVEEKKKKKDKDVGEEVYDITCAPLPSTGTIPKLANGMPAFFAETPETEVVYKILAVSQPAPAPETIAKLYRTTNIMEKAHINSRWLDSSRSLLQQGVKENDKLILRFKYYTFHDIIPQADVVRLTQLYEQSRWAILLEEIECTEEEMMVFAALQYHIGKVSLTEQSVASCPAMEDLDSALQCLEVKMEGESSADDML